MERKDGSWNARRSADVQEYVTSYEESARIDAELREVVCRAVQDMVDRKSAQIRALFSCSCVVPELQVSSRRIVLHHLGGVAFLHLPVQTCTECKSEEAVKPYTVGCCPGTPTTPKVWLHRPLVEDYRENLFDGGSADAYCKRRERLLTVYDPKYGEVNEYGHVYRLRLQPDILADAGIEYGKVRSLADICYCGCALDPVDPWKHCLVCARVPGSPTHHMAIAADGNQKARRFKNAGTASTNLLPTTNTYMGEVADSVIMAHATGELTSKAEDARNRVQGQEGPCSIQLSCNRENSSARGELACHGQVIVVCAHVFAGLGLAVPMPVPENHFFYTVLFREALAQRPDIKSIYLDLSCRYAPAFEALMADLVDSSGWDPTMKVDLMLPWMHAFDHDMACQLKHSGLYRAGVGRRVGEMTEVFWSYTTGFSKLARYMTAAHWYDGFNLLFEHITEIKQLVFPELLAKKVRANGQKLVACAASLEAVESEARQQGVGDLVAALGELELYEQGGAALQLSQGARYVETCMLLESQASLQSQQAPLTLLIRGSMGVHLHAKGSDAAGRDKLTRQKYTLAAQLNMELGSEWEVESAEYRDGIRELRDYNVNYYQQQIEEQVFKRKMIRASKDEEATGTKNAIKLKKQMIAIRSRIKELMSVIETWRIYGTAAVVVPVEDAGLNAVCNGEFPWRVEAAADVGNGGLPAQRHFGRRYCMFKAQLDRTREEEAFLQVEIERTFKWLEYRNGVVSAAMAALQTPTDADSEEAEPTCPLACGKLALLRRELSRLDVIAGDAERKLRRHLK